MAMKRGLKQGKKKAGNKLSPLRERLRDTSQQLQTAKKLLKERLLELKKTHIMQLKEAKECAYQEGVQDAFNEAARKDDAEGKVLSNARTQFEKKYVSSLSRKNKGVKKSAHRAGSSKKPMSPQRMKNRKPSVKKKVDRHTGPSFSQAA